MVREGNIISLKLNQGGPTTTTIGISERSQGVGRGVTERSDQGETLTPLGNFLSRNIQICSFYQGILKYSFLYQFNNSFLI